MSLKSSTKQDKSNLYSLEITVSAEDFQKALNKAFAKIKNRISIPGFRKGKITRKMAETFYGKEFLYEDALEICYPETVEAAITESGLDFVGTGKADVNKMSEADGVEIELEVYVKPEIEVIAYKELK
ncbi:MAG: trigger factor family protein, partial [Oscillospiraceae bacterium]|nr:trigger factor family protein [Oscillospiraceae bacterium]